MIQSYENSTQRFSWNKLALSLIVALSLTSCNYFSTSPDAELSDEDRQKIEEASKLEIADPFSYFDIFLNDKKLEFPGEDFGEYQETAKLVIKSNHPFLDFRVRYFIGEEFQEEGSYQDLVNKVREWQGEFTAREGQVTTYRFEIFPQVHQAARLSKAEQRSSRVIIFKVLPKAEPDPDMQPGSHLPETELIPSIYINGDLYDDDDFAQELTFIKAVALMISPKDKVLFEVSVKESGDGKFHAVTQPDGENQVAIYDLGKLLPGTPNLVEVEIISYQVGNKNKALKKTIQFVVDGSGAVPVLSKDGAELSKNSAHDEDSLTLRFSRKPGYDYSVYVTSLPNVYAPKKHFHLQPKNFSGESFSISLNGQDSADFKIYIKGVHKTTKAKLSQRYFITLTKPDASLIDFALLVDGKKLLASTNTELELDSAKTAHLEVPKVPGLVYAIGVEVNNAAEADQTGIAEFDRDLNIVNNNKTFYKFTITATNSVGKTR